MEMGGEAKSWSLSGLRRQVGGLVAEQGFGLGQSSLLPGPNLTHISRFSKGQDAGLTSAASEF